MINLFQIAPSDQSVYYLGQIFGFVGTLLPTQNPNLLVGLLFKILNTTALTIGAFMVVYVTVVGLLKTAQEGEFLGRQWNSLWVPIRTVLGIAALFPTASGYSAIQVIIMWVILQGVGAADTLWTKTMEYIAVAGSPYAKFAIANMPSIDVQLNMKNLFASLVCQASTKATYPAYYVPDTSTNFADAGKTFRYYCGDPRHQSEGFCTQSDDQMLNPVDDNINNPHQITRSNNVSRYSMGPGGLCGVLTYCDVNAECGTGALSSSVSGGGSSSENGPTGLGGAESGTAASGTPGPGNSKADSTACIACKAQQSALKTIVPTLGAIAAKMTTVDNDYLTFKTTPLAESYSPPAWVQEFCTANNIPIDKCCGTLPPPKDIVEGMNQTVMTAAGMGCSLSIPKDSQSTAGAFYSDSDSQQIQLPIRAERSAIELFLQYPLAEFMDGDKDFINAAVGEYVTTLSGAVLAGIEKQMETTDLSNVKVQVPGMPGVTVTTNWQKQASDLGWILAGGYLYKMARTNSSNQASLKQNFSVSVPDDLSQATLAGYRNNYKAATQLIGLVIASNQQSSMSFANSPGMPSDVSSAVGGFTDGLLTLWRSFLGGDEANPLLAIAAFGSGLMMAAEIIFIVVSGLVFVISMFSSLNVMVLGTGLTMNPLGEGLKAFLGIVGPFFTILVTALFSLGAILGIYVPLIPYMIFTLGAIGWIMATIEAMVAAPIIALGILSPGGQHDILGRAEPALMQLFNIFLRPSLMVFGLVVAMFLSTVVVKLVNAGFLAVSGDILSAMQMTLVEQLLFIAAYTSFIITVLNKAFSLIYVIPERVLTWVGGPAVQYGEQEGLHASKQALEGAAGGMASSGRDTVGSTHSAIMGGRQAKLEAQASAGKANSKQGGAAMLNWKKEAGGGGGGGGGSGSGGASGGGGDQSGSAGSSSTGSGGASGGKSGGDAGSNTASSGDSGGKKE